MATIKDPNGNAYGRGDIHMIPPEDIIIIGLDTADKMGEHELYDERIKLPLDAALTANIEYQGVKVPAMVTKDGGRVLCVDGRQRIRNAREANKNLLARGMEPVRIPCVLCLDSHKGGLFGVFISANELRQDSSGMNRIRNLGRMLSLGRTEAECGVVFGKTPQTIANWMRVLELDTTIHDMIEVGQVSASAALEVGDLPKNKQAAALRKILKKIEEAGKKASANKIKEVRKGKDPEAEGASAKPGVKLPRISDPRGSKEAPTLTTLHALYLLAKKDEGEGPASFLTEEAFNLLHWMMTGDDASEIPGLQKALETIASTVAPPVDDRQLSLLDALPQVAEAAPEASGALSTEESIEAL